MPYRNEHAARLKDPSRYIDFRRENDWGGKGSGVDAIWGVLPSGEVELQAIRFRADKWTVAEAKKWLRDHGYKWILFEPATGGKVVILAPAQFHAIIVERKAFNLRTEEQKAAYWRGFERMRQRWYSAIARQVAKRFDEERADVVRAVKEASARSDMYGEAADALRRNEEAWTRLFKTAYIAIGEDFAPRVLEQLKASPGPGEMKQARSWERYLLDWISRNAGDKVSLIDETTRILLRDAIAEGVEQGESIRDISRRIDALYLQEIVPHRSEVIARTEVISASNAASVFAAQSTGMDLVKQWLSTRDDRTRDTHLMADGQERPIDEPFDVGGYQLMWPGDGSLGAPASELVQCRCTVTYRTV